MKWSMFTFAVDNKNDIIIYNTLNGGVVSLEKKVYDDIQRGMGSKKITNYLKKAEFLIDENIDEKDQFMKAVLEEWNNCGFLALHILTTTGCNFRCPYCYQSGISVANLNDEKVDKILSYIENYIKVNKIKESAVEIT